MSLQLAFKFLVSNSKCAFQGIFNLGITFLANPQKPCLALNETKIILVLRDQADTSTIFKEYLGVGPFHELAWNSSSMMRLPWNSPMALV